MNAIKLPEGVHNKGWSDGGGNSKFHYFSSGRSWAPSLCGMVDLHPAASFVDGAPPISSGFACKRCLTLGQFEL